MSSATAISKSGTNDDNVIFTPGQTEVDRLDMQHKVVHASMPRLVLAPIDLSKGGLRILDQATGSGAWLRDVRASCGSQNTFVGTDIEDEYFPKDPPKDTSYHHQSMTEPWPKDWAKSFDLVHSRMALPGVGMNPLAPTVKDMIDLVKPGGWIQMVEMEWNAWDIGVDGQVFHDAIFGLLTMVSNGTGVQLREKLLPLFQEAGLEDVEYKVIPISYGLHAREDMRELSLASLYATASSMSNTLKMLPPIDLPREKLDAMPEGVVKEAREKGLRTKVFAIWGKKPLV